MTIGYTWQQQRRESDDWHSTDVMLSEQDQDCKGTECDSIYTRFENGYSDSLVIAEQCYLWGKGMSGQTEMFQIMNGVEATKLY